MPTFLTRAPKVIHPGPIVKLEGLGLEHYVQDFSVEDMRQSGDLWRAYASRKGLIDFRANRDPAGRGRVYGYDRKTLTYYQETNGARRRINSGSIKLDVNRFVSGVQAEARAQTADLINGRITGQQWYDESARRAKLSYRAALDVARGSNEPMTDEEKRHWIELAILLLLLLNNTADDILAGKIPADGRLIAQVGSIIASENGSFENWHAWEAGLQGYEEARRILGPNENHCHNDRDKPGCIELSEKGWIPIGQLVPIGLATCRRNCKCRLDFRKSPGLNPPSLF